MSSIKPISTGNTCYSYSEKSLAASVQENNIKEVEEWIKKKKDLNKAYQGGMTALHFAAKKGHSKILKKLIYSGADVNMTDNLLKLPLHYACEIGLKEGFEDLVKKTKDINHRDSKGKTPLHLAVCGYNNFEIVNIMGAQPKINPNLLDQEGYSPLHILSKKNTTLTNLILKILFNCKKCDFNHLTGDGKTILQLLGKTNNVELIQFLKEFHFSKITWNMINPDQKSSEQITENLKNSVVHSGSLIEMVKKNNIKGVEEWIKSKKDLNEKDENNMTALHFAASNRYSEILKKLVIAGADPNIADNFIRLPLHYACENGVWEGFDDLLKATKNINQQDFEGNTPLHFSINGTINHHKIILKMAMQEEIDPNILNLMGYSPLHISCSLNNTILNCMSKTLFNCKKCNFNHLTKDKKKETPLHLLTYENNLDVIQYLKEKYSDKVEWSCENSKKETPTKIATIKKHTELVIFFLKHISELYNPTCPPTLS